MKRLYLMRHGQTEFNVQKLVQGRCNSPLTALGREQAVAAAAWLKRHDVHPDRVIASPLGRATETARIVSDALGIDPDLVEPCEGIIERAYGTFEEGPATDLPTDVWDPGEALIPYGGEGSAALQARMVSTLASAINDPSVQTLLAVSHGSASRQFIQATLTPDQTRPDRLPNCALMLFDFDEAANRFTFTELIDPAQG